MEIRIVEANENNRAELLTLQVKQTQRSFIETVEESLEDAEECPNFQPLGLYGDETLVGFAMVGFFPEEPPQGRAWLDRFLIDQRFQGKGYGRRMLPELLKYIEGHYPCDEIYLSLYQANQTALHLYEQFGFQLTGETDTKGEKIMVKQLETKKQ